MIDHARFKPDFETNLELVRQFDRCMAPGILSKIGFRADNENLRDICLDDSKVLADRNITHGQVADKLEAIIVKVQYLLEQFYTNQPDQKISLSSKRSASELTVDPKVIIAGKWVVDPGVSTNGYQECPFSNFKTRNICGKGRREFTIVNIATQERIKVSEMIPHLIRDHHFFEGNVDYRLDPLQAIQVLALEPGVNYKQEMMQHRFWTSGECGNQTLSNFLKVKNNAEVAFEGNNQDFNAFVLPCDDIERYMDREFTHRQKIENNGKKLNKTVKEINEDINQFIRREQMFHALMCERTDYTCSIDQPIWKSDGKSYLHLFYDKNKSYLSIFGEKDSIDIGGRLLKVRDLIGGYSILSPSDKEIPVLEEDDKVVTKTINEILGN